PGVEPGRRSREHARRGPPRRGVVRERRLPRPGAPVQQGSAAAEGGPVRRILRRLRAIGPGPLLRVSAALTLIALALMVWSMLQPTPLPVMLAMSVGQGLGTLAFALYGYVVLADLLRKRRAGRPGGAPEAER